MPTTASIGVCTTGLHSSATPSCAARLIWKVDKRGLVHRGDEYGFGGGSLLDLTLSGDEEDRAAVGKC